MESNQHTWKTRKKTLLVIIMRINQTCKNKMEKMGKTYDLRINIKTNRKTKSDIIRMNRLTDRN
jgi:hypothetical protein